MYKNIVRIPFKPAPKLKYLNRAFVVRYIQTSTGYYTKKDDCKIPKKKPCPKTGSGRGFYKMLGAAIVGTGAVVAFAKYDEDFRESIHENFPAFDEFISFVTAEETTHVDYIMRTIKNWNIPLEKEDNAEGKTGVQKMMNAVHKAVRWMKSKVADLIDDEKLDDEEKPNLPPCDSGGKPYNPKKAVEKRMLELDKEKIEREEERRREMEELKKAEEIARRKKKRQEEVVAIKVKPARNRKEIEKDLTDQLGLAISAYSKSICFLKKYSESVNAIVGSSIEKPDPKVWTALQKKTAKNQETVSHLSENAIKAESQAMKFLKELNDPRVTKQEGEKSENLEKLVHELKALKAEFSREKNMANMSNTYWTLVKQAREHFLEHLTALFPDLSTTSQSMKLAEAEMDLFILYAFQTILHYQRELHKLDQTNKANMRSAFEKSKIGDPELIECVIETELAKERKKLCEEYKKKLQDLKADCEKKANEAIKKHNMKNTSLLQDALDRKEQQILKKMKRQMEDQLNSEKMKFREEMAGLLGKLSGMDELMKKKAIQEKMAVDAQLLWAACEGLVSAITCDRDCATVTMRALDNEIKGIQLTASKDDELVQAVVAAIPKIAFNRGIFGEPALKERFSNTARVARRVALLPEGGASLPMMLISYFQSLLVLSPTIPIPCNELSDKAVSPESLNNFEILQLSKFWMDRGDWYQVLRFMNMLKGASRVVAQDFLDEVKIFVETKQAADVLIAHASATAIPE